MMLSAYCLAVLLIQSRALAVTSKRKAVCFAALMLLYRSLFANLIGSTKNKLENKINYTYNIST